MHLPIFANGNFVHAADIVVHCDINVVTRNLSDLSASKGVTVEMICCKLKCQG